MSQAPTPAPPIIAQAQSYLTLIECLLLACLEVSATTFPAHCTPTEPVTPQPVQATVKPESHFPLLPQSGVSALTCWTDYRYTLPPQKTKKRKEMQAVPQKGCMLKIFVTFFFKCKFTFSLGEQSVVFHVAASVMESLWHSRA